MRLVAIAFVLGSAAVAAAAPARPAPELIVYWAPPASPPSIAAAVAARARAGAVGFVDRSPAAPPTDDAAAAIAAGRLAYDELRFDDAIAALDRAAATLDVTGGRELDRIAIVDLFLYRALAKIQRGDDASAWDDLIVAARLDHLRVLDPTRFPPRAVDALARAQDAVAGEPRGHLALLGAERCAVTVDAAPWQAGLDLPIGVHWLAATCADRPSFGQRIEVRAEGTAVTAPIAQVPADDDVLIQLRARGGAAVIVVDVVGTSATVRTLAIDGREVARAAVGLTDPTALDAAIAIQLAPPISAHRPWYRARWVWAAAGATAVAAILIPVLVFDDSTATSTRVLRPAGLPW